MGDVFTDMVHGIESFVDSVEGLDPLNGLMHLGDDLLKGLGVPKELTDALNIAVGTLTGDLGMAVQGGVSEVGDISSDASAHPGTTEVGAPTGAPAGYSAPASTADAPPTGAPHAMDLSSQDTQDWMPSDPDLRAKYLDWRNQFGLDGGSKWNQMVNGGKDGFAKALKQKLESDPALLAAFEQDHHVKMCNSVGGGDEEIMVTNDAPSSRGSWDTPAARPGIDHSYLNQPPNGSPPPGGSGGDPGLQDQIGQIMNDPSLSLEDKVMAVLMACYDKMDKDVLQAAANLGSAQAQGNPSNPAQPATQDASSGFYTNTGAPPGAPPSGSGSQSTQTLEIQLQDLIQKRTQLFDLMSNMSKNFNDAAMNSISNMK
ncbi:MAG TPA: hypothetical protein VH208_04840 [Myxococcaceae bacterium]|nr:hypothetical protein [Myxococcaceae bacterium]